MHIESMKQMMECLCTKAKSEIDGNLNGVDAEELGEVVDMIKDLNEGLYYAKITKEMEDAKAEEEAQPEMARYYNGRRYYYYDPVMHGSPKYYDGNRYYRPRSYMKEGDASSVGMRGYNDSRYSNGQYAPDGNTMRQYATRYPDMYDPVNSFNQNKWRLDKSGYNSLESKYDKSKRYYSESKIEHDKGTEEDNNAKLKFLGEFLDTASDDIVDIYNDASSTEQDMIEKKISMLLSKMK